MLTHVISNTIKNAGTLPPWMLLSTVLWHPCVLTAARRAAVRTMEEGTTAAAATKDRFVCP